MKKLTKSQVIKRIKENGKIELYLVPCKANLESIWISPFYAQVEDMNQLEKLINDYTYYNCNSMLGKYPHYYVNETI